MFALVRDLVAGRDVTGIAVEPATLQRHLLAPLAARHGKTACRDDLVRATAWWARIDRELPPIVARMVAAGVRVAPIKGASYATSLYALPAERPMTDVDLLVRPYAKVEQLMRELGFRPLAVPDVHHATPWVRGTLVIDVHRSIISAGRSRIDFDAVWGATRPGWPEGAERLEAVDELVFHLVHMSRVRVRGPLIQVVDAARLIDRQPGRTPAAALERANRWGVGASVEIALAFCRYVLAGEGHLPWWLRSTLFDDVVEVRQPSPLHRAVFDVATAGSLKQLAARAFAVAVSRLRR